MMSYLKRKATIGKIRILVIAPSTDNITRVVFQRKIGSKLVHVAHTATDARNYCALGQYDEIILDVDNIDEFGPVLIKQLRDICDPKAPLHISALGDYRFAHLEEQCVKAGADVFLTYADFSTSSFGKKKVVFPATV